MILKPSRKAVYASFFLVLAVLGICGAAFVRDVSTGAIGRGEFVSLAMLAFGITLSIPIAVRAWQWSRLEISDSGVRWLRWSGPQARRWYPRMEPASLRWNEVREARISGGNFKLTTARYRVTIEVLIFDDKQAAIALVTSKLAAAGVVPTYVGRT